MAPIRRQRYLYCHFCGQKSPYRFDGFIRQFHCTSCDAENHLDENGDITDPPESAFTTSSVAAPRWASERRSLSPSFSPEHPPSAAASIFCKKCLENQHMYQSMLAQYLPSSDSEDPEESEHRERNFYKFKRSVEARYPQVCSECRPKVDAALSQAGYKAKADHLRRMMDRSRTKRTRRRTWLDYFDFVGRALWVLGLLLQLLWQLTLVSSIIGQPVGLLDDREEPPEALLPLRRVSEALPSPEAFSYYCTAVSLSSLWWNPQFVSTFRGFTRHINGLRDWYAFQVVILATRLVFQRVSILKSGGGSNGLTRLLAFHSGMALFVIYIYSVARRAVTKDHTPLFGKTAPVSPMPTDLPEPSPRRRSEPRTANLSQILDEVLQSPPSRLPPSPTQSGYGKNLTPTAISPSLRRAPITRFGSAPPGQSHRPGTNFRPAGGRGIANGQTTPSQDTTYGEEMEWTPTTSQHRAFNSPAGSQSQTPGGKFNDSPTGPDKGPFWYKVPPRPVDPASKIRNPYRQPLIRAPATKLSSQNPAATRPATFDQAQSPHGTSIFGHRPAGREDDLSSGLRIAEPKFFAKPAGNDPRNELSGLFGQSFSLSADEETDEEDEIAARRRVGGEDVARGRRRDSCSGVGGNGVLSPTRFVFLELVVLIGCLAAWVHALWSPPPGGMTAPIPVEDLFTEQEGEEGMEERTIRGLAGSWIPDDRTARLTLAVMATAFVLAARTTLGSFLAIAAGSVASTQGRPSARVQKRRQRKIPWTTYVGLCLGAAETIGAAYCAYEIRVAAVAGSSAGGGGLGAPGSCADEGVYLLGGMVAHRIFHAFL